MGADFGVGVRVRLVRDVERYPHFVARAGLVGTIVEWGWEVQSVRLDEVLVGAEEWDNEVCWYPSNGDDWAEADLEVMS